MRKLQLYRQRCCRAKDRLGQPGFSTGSLSRVGKGKPLAAIVWAWTIHRRSHGGRPQRLGHPRAFSASRQTSGWPMRSIGWLRRRA
jgi:hypothetical protein